MILFIFLAYLKLSGAEYTPGIDTYNFFETKFTETVFYEYFNAIVVGLYVTQDHDNGQLCLDSIYQNLDQLKSLSENYTDT